MGFCARGYFDVRERDGLRVIKRGDEFRGSVLSVAFARAKARAGWGRDGVEPVVGAQETAVVHAFEGSFAGLTTGQPREGR